MVPAVELTGAERKAERERKGDITDIDGVALTV
jgi:hypothetical protein